MSLPTQSRMRLSSVVPLWVRTLTIVALLVLALGCASQVHAAPDQVVYADGLQNGWEDWSFTTHDLANPSPVHAGTKSISITLDAWKGLYLHHAVMDVTPYSALKFWVNGGKAGGQTFQVVPIDKDNKWAPPTPIATYVTGGTLPADKWILVTIPVADLKIADKTNVAGFCLQENTGKPQPVFYVDAISFVGKPSQ